MSFNTRILTHKFEFLAPASLEEVFDLLDKYGAGAKVMAGGTDLVIQMKMNQVKPAAVISLKRVPGLDGISEDDVIRLGAGVPLARVLAAAGKPFKGGRKIQALREAIHNLGKVQVRSVGTLGGNLCNASPAADSAAALLVHRAKVVLKSRAAERTVDLKDFFVDVRKTVLAPGEIMTEVLIPPLDCDPAGVGGAFKKFSRVGSDIAKLSCAVEVERDGNRIVACRAAVGAAAKTPLLIPAVGEELDGQEFSPEAVDRAAARLAETISPVSDIRSTSDYRRETAPVLFQEVFDKAWRRAGGEIL